MSIDDIIADYGNDIKVMIFEHGPMWAAYELGLTVSDVKHAASKMGCGRNDNGDVPEDMVDEWEREFEMCKSIRNIGRAWGCSPQFVKTKLDERGVDTFVGRNNKGNAVDVARRMLAKGAMMKDIEHESGLSKEFIMLAANAEW